MSFIPPPSWAREGGVDLAQERIAARERDAAAKRLVRAEQDARGEGPVRGALRRLGARRHGQDAPPPADCE